MKSFFVRRSRVELPHHFWHYLLRVARLPISPPAPQNWSANIQNISTLRTEIQYFLISSSISGNSPTVRLLYGDIELKDLLPVADTEGYPCTDVVYDNADVIKFLGSPVVA